VEIGFRGVAEFIKKAKKLFIDCLPIISYFNENNINT